jgi:hypothetical protein
MTGTDPAVDETERTSPRKGSHEMRVFLRIGLMVGVIVVVSLAAEVAKTPPKAAACGACRCEETVPRYIAAPFVVRDAALDSRIFVAGPDVHADNVVVRAHGSEELVPVDVEIVEATPDDGAWLTPSELLAADTTFDIEVGGATVHTFTTGTSLSGAPPVVTSLAVDPSGGSLASFCNQKVGVGLQIEGTLARAGYHVVEAILTRGDGTLERRFVYEHMKTVSIGHQTAGADGGVETCLGREDIPWLDPSEDLSVELILYDEAGQPSDTVRIDEVFPIEVDAPGCGPSEPPLPTDDSAMSSGGGCSVGW